MNAKTHNSANLGTWSITLLILSYLNYINLKFSSFGLLTTTLTIVGLYVFVDYGTDYLDFDRRLTHTKANVYYKFLSHLFYQIRKSFNISGHRSALTHSLDMIVVHTTVHYFILKYLYKLVLPFLISLAGEDQLLLELFKYVDSTLIGLLAFGFWMGCMSHWFLDLITNEGAQLSIFAQNFKVNLVFVISFFNTSTDWELFVRKISVKSGLILSILATIQILTNTIKPIPVEYFRDITLFGKLVLIFKVLKFPVLILLLLLLIFKILNLGIKKIKKMKK